VILYEMMAGTPPFRGDSAIEILNAILKEDPPTLRYQEAPIPEELELVVQHCLEKAPDARFQTARDLIFGLELTGEPVRRAKRRRTSPATFLSATRRLLASIFN
jgi:serine/threonine protein kinase